MSDYHNASYIIIFAVQGVRNMAGTGEGGNNRGLYFDDRGAGQRFASETCTVDEGQIFAFAKQFDPQPFHLDGEAARTTLFGGLAASGWHTAAITMRLLVDGGLPI